jgi:hypothetical protein
MARKVSCRTTSSYPLIVSSPRDSITLHRTRNETDTILDVSCSIPTVAAEDEPGYLRVRPPFVRSYVNCEFIRQLIYTSNIRAVMAWCIQIPPLPSNQLLRPNPSRRGTGGNPLLPFPSSKPRLKITLFHSHSLRLPLLSSFPLVPYLTSLLPSLVRVVRERGMRIPRLLGYPFGTVGVDAVRWDVGREVLSVEYEVWSEEHSHDIKSNERRTVHFRLPGGGGWDIRHSSHSGPDPSTSQASASLPSPSLSPEVTLTRSTLSDKEGSDILLSMKHLPSSHLRPVRISLRIELVSHSLGIRINGVPAIIALPSLPPTSASPTKGQSRAMQNVEVASLHTVDLSIHSGSDSTGNSLREGASLESHAKDLKDKEERRQKAILTRVKRNYIYFTSLLQEPEVKWTRCESKRLTRSFIQPADRLVS